MKRLQYILNLLLASLLMTACTKELVNTTFEKDVTLKLRFASDKLQSRSEGDVTDPEYAFYTIDLFLYPNDTNQETVEPIVTVPRVDYGTTNGDTDNNHEVEVSVTLSDTEMKSLFGDNYASATNNLTCYAYAIVNGPDIPSGNDKTIANLKQIAIEATFTEPQTRFVMDGGNPVTYSTTDKVVTGTIQVTRAASKISLFVTGIDKTVTDDAGNIWIPYQTTKKVTENGVETEVPYFPIEVAFNKGVKKANVNVGEGRPNNPHTYSGNNIVDDVFFNTVNRDMDNTFVEETNKYTLTTTHDPFYTYSSDWGRDTNPDHEPSITLMVPWVKKYDKNGNEIDNASYQMCYYQVPINAIKAEGKEANCFERNTYYRINLHVGILGDFNPNNPVTLTASYYVVDWKPQPVDVNIKNYKYLVVDKNKVTVYNEEDCIVNFISSDDVSVQILSITRPYYKDITATIENIYTYNNGTELSSTNGFTLTAENGVLKLHHTLENNINSSTFDYVPYTVKVKIWHTNASTKFVEEIEFVQYPAVYVVNSLNNGTTDTRNSDYLDDNSYNQASGFGYVMVNTLYENRYDYDDAYSNKNYGNIWQTVEGFDSSSKNPNMYIVTTTALDSSLDYLLGDSRETTTYTDDQMGFTSISDVNNKYLVKYRPTKTDNENYLSPKFRISSAYGQLGSNDMSLANAKKRCAAYQEYGYPAGRWRLATTAELRYIATLCAKGALPISLFGGSSYWSATNAYTINTSSGTVSQSSSNSAYLRCVYDDWYWGSNSLKNKTKYTWGDESTTEQLNSMTSQQ